MSPANSLRPGGSLRRLLADDDGQMLPVIALMLVALLCMAGFTIDLGRALYSQRELQASTDAAAMAGAGLLPAASAITTAIQYSSLPGGLNAYNSLPNVTMVSGYPRISCLSALTAEGDVCLAPANGNAVIVKQQMILPLFFMQLVGKSSLKLAASATASMHGSVPSPYNVVIVVDSTASMNDLDTGSKCNTTRISCAMAGVQVLLQNLSPCGAGLTSCGVATNGNVPNVVDTVSLYTFPAVASAADAAIASNCTGNSPRITPYSYPSLPIYQIVGFSSDYRTSDTASSLASTSNLTKVAGGKTNCPGLRAIGGEGTYYAGVIYAAQAALVAQRSNTPGTENVLILLSDGDASAPQSALPGAATTRNNGIYPSIYNQCQQAITAAKAATAAGTNVYAVAYGATDSGCATDTPGITPCQTMQQIASVPQNFFSDYVATGGSSTCVSASHPTADLNQIFIQIAGGLTHGRLIPDGTQ